MSCGVYGDWIILGKRRDRVTWASSVHFQKLQVVRIDELCMCSLTETLPEVRFCRICSAWQFATSGVQRQYTSGVVLARTRRRPDKVWGVSGHYQLRDMGQDGAAWYVPHLEKA